MTNESTGVVYVLTNPAMPGLVKIGKTTQDDPNSRVNQLYTTGVPVPFTVEFACRVADPSDVEKRLHTAFGPSRVNPKREFFEIEPEQAISILELLHIEGDVTSEIENENANLDSQEIEAASQMKKKRRPNFNFDEMEIPTDSELHSTHSEDTVIICSPKKVLFDGDEMTLSAATKQMMGTSYNLAPCRFWSYNGKNLRDIYTETYGEV